MFSWWKMHKIFPMIFHVEIMTLGFEVAVRKIQALSENFIFNLTTPARCWNVCWLCSCSFALIVIYLTGYLLCCGVDPKTHPVKQELDRIRTYMGKVKEIEDRKNGEMFLCLVRFTRLVPTIKSSFYLPLTYLLQKLCVVSWTCTAPNQKILWHE